MKDKATKLTQLQKKRVPRIWESLLSSFYIFSFFYKIIKIRLFDLFLDVIQA